MQRPFSGETQFKTICAFGGSLARKAKSESIGIAEKACHVGTCRGEVKKLVGVEVARGIGCEVVKKLHVKEWLVLKFALQAGHICQKESRITAGVLSANSMTPGRFSPIRTYP